MKFQDLFQKAIDFMNNIIEVLVGLALVGFLWGIFKYFVKSKDSSQRAESKKFMIYGILSLLVIISLWGFVYFIGDFIGVKIERGSGGDVFNSVGSGGDLGPSLNPGSGNTFFERAEDFDMGGTDYTNINSQWNSSSEPQNDVWGEWIE